MALLVPSLRCPCQCHVGLCWLLLVMLGYGGGSGVSHVAVALWPSPPEKEPTASMAAGKR